MKLRLFCASMALASIALVPTVRAETLEVALKGLNCALCGEAIQNHLKQLVHASAVVPKLECERLFLEVPDGAPVNQMAMATYLLSEGFVLDSVKPVNLSLTAAVAEVSC